MAGWVTIPTVTALLLLNTYYFTNTPLTAPREGCCHHPRLTDEETEAERLSDS